jgi:hypothetical protein
MSFSTREENPGLVEMLTHLLADDVAKHTRTDIVPSFSVFNEKVELTSLGKQFSDACVVPSKPQ